MVFDFFAQAEVAVEVVELVIHHVRVGAAHESVQLALLLLSCAVHVTLILLIIVREGLLLKILLVHLTYPLQISRLHMLLNFAHQILIIYLKLYIYFGFLGVFEELRIIINNVIISKFILRLHSRTHAQLIVLLKFCCEVFAEVFFIQEL